MKRTFAWETAVHEAGHLVMACLLGVKVYKATLLQNPSSNFSGYILLERRNEPSLEFLEALIATYLAGMEAERVFFGSAYYIHSRDDYKRFFRMIISLYYHQGEYKHLDSEARKAFINHQASRRSTMVADLLGSKEIKASIHYVAHLLRTKKVLNQSEIALLRRKIRPRSAYSIRAKVTSMFLQG